jgi:hypothetical protein
MRNTASRSRRIQFDVKLHEPVIRCRMRDHETARVIVRPRNAPRCARCIERKPRKTTHDADAHRRAKQNGEAHERRFERMWMTRASTRHEPRRIRCTHAQREQHRMGAQGNERGRLHRPLHKRHRALAV